MPEKFIKKAIKKPGALRKALGIKKGFKVRSNLLEDIIQTPVGQKFTLKGKKKRVTDKLKKRAVLAETLMKMRRR